MNAIQRWMECCNYNIFDSWDFLWECWPSCLVISAKSQSGRNEFSIYFDKNTRVVHQVSAYDNLHNRAYRWMNPDTRTAYLAESLNLNAGDEAWEGVNYTDLDSQDDFFDKMSQIYQEAEYDTRVVVPLVIGDQEFIHVAKMAHERDITFNRMVELLLTEYLSKMQQKSNRDDLHTPTMGLS